MSDNYQSVTEEPVETDESSLDSGNRKLAFLAGGVVVLLGAALAFGPAGNRERIANGQMPSFELVGASVVGSRAAAEEVAAPTEAAAPAPEATKASAAPAKPVAAATRTAAAAPAASSATPAAAPAAEPTTAEPAAPAAPAVEEAPRTATLNGRILDENGKPLAGATVFVKGTNKIASTDQNGNYTVETPAGETSVVYGYGGYQDQEMRVRSGQPNNVTLLPSETSKRRRR
ncbi:carboxypeptidase-like regulatory domain-containing protein [Hymenobacter sp. 15J16-1T3B]|uniref:carboxypeptidase-like regulatory domain-containing protein n=1 Tax=Hymenobacter sp. 15J16-1T3B TaxID=2886941 RepID=UPI001D1106EA|nr:carboxypeptidase-like regulatory domain-containing protein [Hymenobacter sp. 15J16-1T3B]MCC3156868.1 carboxypeptidase-like regulatory domain-containing protein [Hymenobacter sp. 15J16-1T3B]